jgi:hypothetical protein
MHAHEGWPGEQEPGCDMLPTLGVGGSACAENDGHQDEQLVSDPIGMRSSARGNLALCLDPTTKQDVLDTAGMAHWVCLTGGATTCNPSCDVSSYKGGGLMLVDFQMARFLLAEEDQTAEFETGPVWA